MTDSCDKMDASQLIPYIDRINILFFFLQIAQPERLNHKHIQHCQRISNHKKYCEKNPENHASSTNQLSLMSRTMVYNTGKVVEFIELILECGWVNSQCPY